MEVKELGKHIVADPKICNGKPTFRGTRIMVWQVLNMLERGMDWDGIVEKWEGSITKEAIAEAIEVASNALIEHETRRLPDSELIGEEGVVADPLSLSLEAKALGTYLVADPQICHGQPTFCGTRILVKTVLAMVARQMDWDRIANNWDGRVSKQAIAEAITVASDALLRYESLPAAELELVNQ